MFFAHMDKLCINTVFLCLFQQSSKSEEVKSSDSAKESSDHFWNPWLYFHISFTDCFAFFFILLFFTQIQTTPAQIMHSLLHSASQS